MDEDPEDVLLASDPILSRFKSTKKSVKTLKRVGDVLSIVVVAGCCYEIYVKATMREEAQRKVATGSVSSLIGPMCYVWLKPDIPLMVGLKRRLSRRKSLLGLLIE